MVAGAVAGLTACGSSSGGNDAASAGPVQRGGALTLATPVEPTSLDPAVGDTDPGSQHAQTLIFDRLIEVQPGTSKLIPGLAASWALSKDRRSATFHLRAARFSDGTPVTSEDVKFSFERAIDVKVDPAFGDTLSQLIESIGTPDPHTVVLHFAGPRPAIFAYLAFAPLSVVSKRAFDRLGARRFATQPLDAGSGPFKIVRWVRGQNVQLVRNPYYWRSGLPYLDRVTLNYVPDDNTRMLDVRSGQVDVADDVPYSQLATIRSASGVKLQTTPIAAIYTIAMNATGPLKSVAVREALNYATPKDVIRKIVLGGQGTIANSLIPPMRYWSASVKPYPYDLARAKRLLGQAGMPNGFSLQLLIQAGDAVSRQTASILQSTWAKIGVRLHILALDSGTLNSRASTANGWQATLYPPNAWSSDMPAEDEFAINATSPGYQQVLNYSDPKLTKLIGQIEGTWDEGARRRLFPQFQQAELTDPWGVPITVVDSRTALSDSVQGFAYFAMNWWYLDRTWIKR